MATKTFSGQLDQAIEGAASGNKLLFVPQENLGEVLMGAASEMMVGDDGTYSITLAYNTYSVYHYSDVTKCKILIADGVEVSASTSVSTIPDLIGVSVPVTDSDVLTNQGYLQEGQDYAASTKTSAEESDELFNSFGLRVGQAIEPIETGVPILDAPFNDSGILKKGIGTEYVSGLPVYGVDFTRSTTSTVINKSGVLETLAADEIGIGADGVWFHGAYSNYIKYSEDLTQSNWVKSGACTVTEDSGVIAPDGSSPSYLVENCGSFSNRLYQVYSIPESDTYTSSLHVKGTAGGSILLVAQSGTSVTEEIEFDGTWQIIKISQEITASNVEVRVYGTGGATSFYAWGGSITDTASYVPYLPTTSSTASATATSCAVPVSGNLPAVGESFTICVDAEFEDNDEYYGVFSIASDASSGVILMRKYNGSVQWYHDASDGTDASLSTSNTSYTVGRHRYTMTFDDGVFTLYCDGVLVTSRTAEDYCWFNPSGSITLSSSYNNQLKNFKVLPYAASADEVKSWGAPK